MEYNYCSINYSLISNQLLKEYNNNFFYTLIFAWQIIYRTVARIAMDLLPKAVFCIFFFSLFIRSRKIANLLITFDRMPWHAFKGEG